MSDNEKFDENIFQLIYVSTATHGLEIEDIHDIEKTSATNNDLIGITGLLLYKYGKFMQVLEGPESEVRKLFSVISKDPRHKNLIVIKEGVIPIRQFSGWSMRYMPLSEIQSYGGLIHKKIFSTKSLAKEVMQSSQDTMQLLLNFKQQRFNYA